MQPENLVFCTFFKYFVWISFIAVKIKGSLRKPSQVLSPWWTFSLRYTKHTSNLTGHQLTIFWMIDHVNLYTLMFLCVVIGSKKLMAIKCYKNILYYILKICHQTTGPVSSNVRQVVVLKIYLKALHSILGGW